SGTTTETLFSQVIPTGAVVGFTARAMGKNGGNTKSFGYTMRGHVWNDGTTVRKVVTETIEGGAVDNAGSSVTMTGISLTVSATAFSIRFAGATGEEWEGF